MTRRGFSMVEVLLAVGLIGVLVVFGLPSVQTGAGNAVRAGEEQLAATLAARTLDRLLMAGYGSLFSQSEDDKEHELDLACLGERPAAPGPIQPLTVDGVPYRGHYTVDRMGADMLRITLRLSWNRGNVTGDTEARLIVTRYLSDPALSLSVREGSRGAE